MRNLAQQRKKIQ